MYGQTTRKKRWGEFCFGPVSEPAFSENTAGGFAEASYWIRQQYFSSLAIFLSGGLELFFSLLLMLVFFYTHEFISYLMNLI